MTVIMLRGVIGRFRFPTGEAARFPYLQHMHHEVMVAHDRHSSASERVSEYLLTSNQVQILKHQNDSGKSHASLSSYLEFHKSIVSKQVLISSFKFDMRMVLQKSFQHGWMRWIHFHPTHCPRRT